MACVMSTRRVRSVSGRQGYHVLRLNFCLGKACRGGEEKWKARDRVQISVDTDAYGGMTYLPHM